jgi:hypothetical protein
MNKKAMDRTLTLKNRFGDLQECEGCEISKRRQKTIPKLSKNPAQQPLEIVEMDF